MIDQQILNMLHLLIEWPKLKKCILFGTEISKETGLAASDHYGIMVEMDF